MPRKKRRRPKGSIFEHRNGYRVSVTIGYYPDGSQRKKVADCKTFQEAQEKLEELQSLSRKLRKSKYTLTEWLESYIDFKKRGSRPRTRESHITYSKKIIPALGDKQLVLLNRSDIQKFYADLYDEGLSKEYRLHIHHFLKAALNEAQEHELIAKNVSKSVEVPKGKSKNKSQAWLPHHVAAFMQAAKCNRFYAFFYIMITQGLRPGEALALRWSDLLMNGSEGILIIDETLGRLDSKMNRTLSFDVPKTERGERQIALSNEAVRVLLNHKEAQKAEQSSPNWQEYNLMFPSIKGTPMHDGNLTRRYFKPLIQIAGVPKIRLYDLRHTHITLARDNGIDLEVVAHRAGQHPSVTASVYSKVSMQRNRKAALSLEDLIDESDLIPEKVPEED